MSNSKKLRKEKKATLFSQFSKVMELTNEGKRDSDMVSRVLQGIIENKRLEVAPSIISIDLPIITMQIRPLSLKDLVNKYGTGETGFEERMLRLGEVTRDIPESGPYQINIEKHLACMEYIEQSYELRFNDNEWSIPHPAVVAQVILKYYEVTGKRLLKNWYSRTNLTYTSNPGLGHPRRVVVGGFDSDGLKVIASDWSTRSSSRIGVARSKKLSNSLNLES